VLIIHVDVCSKITNAIPKLNFNKGNYNELRKYLDIDWDSLLQQYIGDVEMMWNIITDKLLEGVNKYIPTTLPFTSWKKDKWKKPLDVEIRNLIKDKSTLWRRYIRSKDPLILSQYKKIKKQS